MKQHELNKKIIKQNEQNKQNKITMRGVLIDLKLEQNVTICSHLSYFSMIII